MRFDLEVGDKNAGSIVLRSSGAYLGQVGHTLISSSYPITGTAIERRTVRFMANRPTALDIMEGSTRTD